MRFSCFDSLALYANDFSQDEAKNIQFTVLTDRSQGGSSLNDGQVELMVRHTHTHTRTRTRTRTHTHTHTYTVIYTYAHTCHINMNNQQTTSP